VRHCLASLSPRYFNARSSDLYGCSLLCNDRLNVSLQQMQVEHIGDQPFVDGFSSCIAFGARSNLRSCTCAGLLHHNSEHATHSRYAEAHCCRTGWYQDTTTPESG
jgi:hypothetical protein